MKKVPTVLERDPANPRLVTDAVTPGCEWVLAGEGAATRKYDGTCVMYDGKLWWARRDVRPGQRAPVGFRAVELDPRTERMVGWMPAAQSPFSAFHTEAAAHLIHYPMIPVGTYELCGPKINGNPERLEGHRLILHATAERLDLSEDGAPPWTPEEIRSMVLWGAERGWEGIVWHHPDGRMAKLKARDLSAEEMG